MGDSGAECDCTAAVYDPVMEIKDTGSTSCAAAPCPGPCENAGVCTDVSSTATCVCKVETGFEPDSFFKGAVCADFDYLTMITKVIELNTKDGTIVQSIADGIVAADTKVDVVKSALEARITGDVGVVQGEVTGVAALVGVNAAAILSARSDLTTKIDADLVAQALAIASETDVKVETAKTALEALITSNDGEITVLSAGQITLAAEIQANLASIGGEVLAREAEDVLLNARVDGEVADIATNAAAILAEAATRTADDVALGTRIDDELVDIAGNSAAIQANTDNDDTFRSFSWTDGVQSIYNMVSATNLADMITEKETLEALIDAPFSSSD